MESLMWWLSALTFEDKKELEIKDNSESIKPQRN
jgi:hypothetical protein